MERFRIERIEGLLEAATRPSRRNVAERGLEAATADFVWDFDAAAHAARGPLFPTQRAGQRYAVRSPSNEVITAASIARKVGKFLGATLDDDRHARRLRWSS